MNKQPYPLITYYINSTRKLDQLFKIIKNISHQESKLYYIINIICGIIRSDLFNVRFYHYFRNHQSFVLHNF